MRQGRESVSQWVIVGLAALALAACAQTQVKTVKESAAPLPRPDRIFVYDFAVSPDEVKLDRGISARLEDLVEKTPRTSEEKEVGHKVANALAGELLKEIRAMGLPAERAAGVPPSGGNIFEVDGQFLSVNEGNRTERVVIGLGAGRTDVKTLVQVYDARGEERALVAEFDVNAESGRKPGAAETMGAGAVAGHLATSAVVSSGLAVESETMGATVEADAKRTAKDISKRLGAFFASQGWIPLSAVK